MQATKFTPNFVDERIEAFIDWFINDKLKKLTDEEFETVVKTLIKKRTEVDVNLHQEFWRNWNEIVDQEYLFDRRDKEIKILENCNKSTMIEFMSNLLSKEGKNYKKLSIQVVGSETVDETVIDDKPDEAVYELQYHSSHEESFIDDVYDYKLTLQPFPVHKLIT